MPNEQNNEPNNVDNENNDPSSSDVIPSGSEQEDPANNGEQGDKGVADGEALVKDLPNALGEAAKKTKEGEDGAQGAPETYQSFKLENGQEYAPEQVEAFTQTAKELGLSQEKAQKLFSSMEGTTKQVLAEKVTGYAKRWAEESKADPEFGGEKFNENMAIAGKAFDAYATPKLRKILDASGLGNCPEVIRMFFRIGKGMQQDHGVKGEASAPAARAPHYAKSNMVEDEY